jgi:protein TonB
MNERTSASMPLMLALLCSLALHAALLAGAPRWLSLQTPPAPPRPPNTLQARLALLAPLPQLQPQWTLPEETKPPSVPRPPRPPRPKPPPATPATAPAATLAASAQQQLRRMDFYPLKAIQNGWQGEAWVQIFLDDDGNVIAARLETSSGYPLLDAAAVNAARSLKSLPNSGLDSALLPVRFRLE